jgi:hypothetical protein
MNSPNSSGLLTAILPCNDLDASERFYNRLGFARPDSQRPAPGEPDTYRMLSNGKDGYLHLTDAVEGRLVPGKIHLGYIFILKTLTWWLANFRNRPKTSRGECMNSQCLIRMKRWSVSVGRLACADHAEARQLAVSVQGPSLDFSDLSPCPS